MNPGQNAQGPPIPRFGFGGQKAALGQLFLHMADKPAGGLGQPGKAVLFPAGEQLHAPHVFLGIGLYQPLYTAQELLLGPLPPFLRWKPEDSLEKVVHQCAILKHIHLSPAALLGVQAIAAEVLKPALVIGLHLGGGQKQLFPKKLPGQRFVLQPGQPLARGPLQGLHPPGIGRVPRKKQPQGPGLSIAGRKAGRQPGEGRRRDAVKRSKGQRACMCLLPFSCSPEECINNFQTILKRFQNKRALCYPIAASCIQSVMEPL
mgnify:CR=1 FL=1